MEVALITKADLDDFKKELLYAVSQAIKEENVSQEKEWLKTKEVCAILKCSPASIQNLRIRGLLPFSKVAGTCYYKREDVLKLLNHKI